MALDEVHLFVNKSKLPTEFERECSENNVRVHNYENMKAIFENLVSKSQKKVWINPLAAYTLNALVPEKKLFQELSPICTIKAIKNATEAQGMINSHIRDGVALCKYFAWLEDALNRGEKVDEISGAAKLQGYREWVSVCWSAVVCNVAYLYLSCRKLTNFVGLSFPTINGSGPNGAIIHYQPKPDTNRPITLDDMYLCDSGAQYL